MIKLKIISTEELKPVVTPKFDKYKLVVYEVEVLADDYQEYIGQTTKFILNKSKDWLVGRTITLGNYNFPTLVMESYWWAQKLRVRKKDETIKK